MTCVGDDMRGRLSTLLNNHLFCTYIYFVRIFPGKVFLGKGKSSIWQNFCQLRTGEAVLRPLDREAYPK